MAIKKNILSSVEPKKVSFEFDNGDLQAVESVMARYRFVDEQAMFRFALVALLRAEKKGVYIDEGDARIFLSPAQGIVKPDESFEGGSSSASLVV